jgi:hypothetical protein
MLIKCYYHLHPLVEFEKGVVDQKVEEDMSLDIFEMTTNTSEPSIKLINIKFLIFKHYQVDVKNIKCPMQWWEKHESMFPTIIFCAKQILGIVVCQIKTKRIISLVGILTNFRKCRL